MSYKNIALVSNSKEKSLKFKKEILQKYPRITEFDQKKAKKYDLILSLGGDGFMLKTIHSYINLDIPFYGINSGTMGFLMNEFKPDEDLMKVINGSKKIGIKYLEADVIDAKGKKYSDIAINEVSLFRSTHQMAKIQIEINGVLRMKELLGDGVLVSTVIGSGAYNFSANGSILPLNSNLLSLMPISPFRPKRWAGAILDDNSKIKLTVIDEHNRKVSMMSDYIEFQNIRSVEVKVNKKKEIKLLFNKNLQLEEKIICEQFSGY